MGPLDKLVVAICTKNKDMPLPPAQTGINSIIASSNTSNRPTSFSTLLPHMAPSYLGPLAPITSTNPSDTLHIPPTSLFPSSITFDNILSRPLDKNAVELMEDGFAKGTIGNYTFALNTFTKFCDNHGVASDLRFPADERVLCAFATSLNQSVSGSTAKAMFTGLKRWHDLHHVEWNGSERVALMVRGVKKNAPPDSKRPKRLAVTPRMIMDLDTSLNHDDPKDSAILACAKAAFFGQGRLGEFLASSRLKHNSSTHPSRCSVIILLNNNAREIKLPRTKINQADGESIYLTRQSDPLDPVKALENHFRVNHSLADSDHLFAYRSSVSRSGRHSLTKEDFMNRVNEVWTALGYQKFTGHSFRIGGTTTLLRNGVPPDVVKELGRWSSDAFHEYWRDIPEIATRHVEFLQIPDIAQGQHDNNITSQARLHCRPPSRRDGQIRLQGRPAYRPY